MNIPLLKKIKDPVDLKKIPQEELPLLAEEIRRTIIDTVSTNGGHLASNLGVVEMTMALHYVFDSPDDRIIFDVGHQCYTHKLLTGRAGRFSTLRKKNGLSGFPKRSESPHDTVETGHASTSISYGTGISAALHLLEKNQRVICVIGDGALTGGQALEALNYAGHLKKQIIIILNDNEMSINRNVGGISSYLSRITVTRRYENFRRVVDAIIRHIPLIGKPMLAFVYRLKRGMKGLFYRETLFTDLGFDYVGPLDGHDLKSLIKTFTDVKSLKNPVVIHTITTKGKGYQPAEGNPSSYHGVSPTPKEAGGGMTMTRAFGQSLTELAEKDSRITAITAAMMEGTGLSDFHDRFPTRFFDVGIAEQHAVTFAAGQALTGLRPVVAIYSTFMQRSVDQLVHDIAIPGLPVVIAMDRAGLVPQDGETHQGIFDLQLFRSIPGITFMLPATASEMKMALAFALEQSAPCLLRYPKDDCHDDKKDFTRPFEAGRGIITKKTDGAMVLILSAGGLLEEAEKSAALLKKEGFPTDVYHMRFIAPLDEAHLTELSVSYKFIFCVEEGIKQGGIGERIGSLLKENEVPALYRGFGIDGSFPPHASRKELIQHYGLDGKSLAARIQEIVETHRFRKVVEQVKQDRWKTRIT
jgi:1-deoxy-D-xylulose-5-phosphate synthase